MNRNTLRSIAQLLSPALFLTVLATGQELSSSDREKGLRYLAETRNGVVEATKGLSEAQWKFKPAPDRDPKQVDAAILAKMPDRSTKYQAPPPIVPTGRWAPQAALD